tara:strand:- start:99 stop:518 length:420 start_codon:yes stop_codon:yes gene_type:complete
MTKAINTLHDNYDIQESWIRRQIDSLKYDSFIDLKGAQSEIEDLGIAAFATPHDVNTFRKRYLSELGIKRLSSLLRTNKKRYIRRQVTQRLDIDLSKQAYIALEILVRKKRMTKIQLIEQLILEEKEKLDIFCDSVTND